MQAGDEGELIERVATGDSSAIGPLLGLHSERLKRMLDVRIHPLVRARVDASDIWQDIQLEANRRLPEFMANREVPFFIWLRFLAKQKLSEVLRKHLGVKARTPHREQKLEDRQDESVSSLTLAGFLVASTTSPTAHLRREELRLTVTKAIQELSDIDREIVLLRHVEELSTVEAASELGISTATCRQRHLRALQRLRTALSDFQLKWALDDG